MGALTMPRSEWKGVDPTGHSLEAISMSFGLSQSYTQALRGDNEAPATSIRPVIMS